MQDTIAAISSAPGPAARIVVRLSGPDAFALAGALLAEGPKPDALRGFSAPPVRIGLPSGATFTARMLVMRAPKSYTTEDLVEFHLPGAAALAESVLDACLKAGARRAGPGEFTRRAYLGGRLDSCQVEGVLRLIESRSDAERRAALDLLMGRAGREAEAARALLKDAKAALEAYLDFTDEDTESLDASALQDKLRSARARLERMGPALARRMPRRDLPQVVLLGPPNAGKSTLFNALVPSGRVVTSPEPGTTRDLLEGCVEARRTFLLYDAPGVAISRDPLERLALSRLAGRMSRMDAVLILLDRSVFPPAPGEWASLLERAGTRPHLFVLAKSDLPAHPAWSDFRFDDAPAVVSAAAGEGLEDLLARLALLLPEKSAPGGGIDFQLTQAVQEASSALREALEEDWNGGLELVSMVLEEALEAVGRLTRPVRDEEVLDAVFSRFCIGK